MTNHIKQIAYIDYKSQLTNKNNLVAQKNKLMTKIIMVNYMK